MMNKLIIIRFIKMFCLLNLVLFNGSTALAGEYVPPPTGPYQSTVIINKNPFQSNNSEQVYRFPSEDLIQQKKIFNPVNSTIKQVEPFKQEVALPVPTRDKVTTKGIPPKVERTVQLSNKAANYYPANPWAPESQAYPGNYQGNYWNNPQYSLPPQYPPGYNNQNNFMNEAFNGMPTPWNSMPMQPFFSGRSSK